MKNLIIYPIIYIVIAIIFFTQKIAYSNEKAVLPRELYDPISISAKEISINDILLFLSKNSRLSFYIPSDNIEMDKKISVDFKNIPMINALQYILSHLYLAYKVEDNVITIYKEKMDTRIFPINYISTIRTGGAELKASPGSETTLSESSGGGGSVASGNSKGYSSIKTEDKTDLWNSIKDNIKIFLSEKGEITLNEMAGIAVIKDYQSNLDKIAEYINTVTKSIQRQVMIEVKIMQVSLSDGFKAGLNWKNILGSIGLSGNVTGELSIEGEGFTLAPLTGPVAITTPNNKLTDLINAISEQGKVKIISKPSISTLNNQKAIIKVAKEDAYFVSVIQNTSSGTTETQQPKFITVGVVLDVTPQIAEDDYIIMNIHPSITEKVGIATSSSGDTAPIVDVREINSVVRIKEGKSVVIAGLMQEKTTTGGNNLPGIRWLGPFKYLFGYREEIKEDTELVILLTPSIHTIIAENKEL